MPHYHHGGNPGADYLGPDSPAPPYNYRYGYEYPYNQYSAPAGPPPIDWEAKNAVLQNSFPSKSHVHMSSSSQSTAPRSHAQYYAGYGTSSDYNTPYGATVHAPHSAWCHSSCTTFSVRRLRLFCRGILWQYPVLRERYKQHPRHGVPFCILYANPFRL